MHDFYLAKEILDTVLREAKKNNLKTVSKVFFSLGEFKEHNEKILPKNIKRNFYLLAKNTLASKALVIIKQLDQSGVWRLEEIEGKWLFDKKTAEAVAVFFYFFLMPKARADFIFVFYWVIGKPPAGAIPKSMLILIRQ